MGEQILNARMQTLATKLVTKFAGPTGTATFTITTKGSYDPLTGAESADTSVSTQPDVSPPVPVTQKMVSDNSGVLMGDMVVWIDAPRVTITKGMINHVDITYGGFKYSMPHFNEYYAGEDIAAYEVFLRDV